MATALDFYFEFSSPYGYFASTQIEELARESGGELRWHPILLGPMFKAMGSAPLTEIPLKGDYARRDFARTAELFGIPYKHPASFPVATVSAARAVLHVQRHDPAKAAELIKKLYRGFFAENRNISDTDVVLDIAAEVGLDRASVASAMAQDEVKALLKDKVNEAMSRGVFGSPFIFVDDEPFWGFDRFDHIRKWLSTRR